MSDNLSGALGLAVTPTFAHEHWMPPGEHFVLLDGVRGSFCLSQQEHVDLAIDVKSWAWSAGVLHHVTMTKDHVLVQRWDRSDPARYTRRSVIENLDRFYSHISSSQPVINRTLATHTVESFARLRSNFTEERQSDALAVFLLLLGGLIQTPAEADVRERAEDITERFQLEENAPNALANVSPELMTHFISGFRTPLLNKSHTLTTLPSFVIRHAGALIFQEAHFELVQRGVSDLFGVPSPAKLGARTASGVHFTPPGLARALIEQSLDAKGPLPPEITILDAACGSGSILYEALRTLKDRQYKGVIRLIGMDESGYAVQMSKFLLAAAKQDWPEAKFTFSIQQRDSLSDEPWPVADIILMNPPFLSLRDLAPNHKKSLQKILGKHAKGRPDLSMAFVQRGLEALAPNGVLGTLLPAGVLSMTYAQEWRRHLLDEASMAFVGVFGELGLFRLATVETGCIVLRKGSDKNGLCRSLWVGETKNATPDALRFLRKATALGSADGESEAWTLTEFPEHALRDSANWRPAPQSLRRELKIISNQVSTTVSSLFEVKQGALPAPRAAFIIRVDQWESLPARERQWFRRVAENQNIRNGQILDGPYIFYPKSPELPPLDSEQQLFERLPTFKDHLLKFKHALEIRRGKQDRWWELGEDRKWLRAPQKKILSSYFGQSGSFGYDEDGDRVVVQGYGWLPRWKSLTSVSEDKIFHAYIAIFNSDFFSELLGEICPTVGGGQLNLSKRYSEQVYLPDLIERIQSSAVPDPTFKDLAFFGGIIAEDGLTAAPRAKIEDLVRSLYGI